MAFRTIRLGGVSVLVAIRDDSLVHKVVRGVRRLFGGKVSPPPDEDAKYRRPSFASLDAELPSDRDTLLATIDDIEWYHSIDLGNGVVTPGLFDHAPYVDRYGLPERLEGMRVLDVATLDGFWAFELERRGAKEVVALDVDRIADLDLRPAVRARLTPEQLDASLGAGFVRAKRLLDSKVTRRALSVYDLSPESVGVFDFVFVGSLLMHLTNPIGALQNVASVTSGHAIFAEACHAALPEQFIRYGGGEHRSVWWYLGPETLERMIEGAGFSRVERVGLIDLPPRVGPTVRHAIFRAYK